MTPVIEALYRQGYDIRRINIDGQIEIAKRHKVTAVPTIIAIADGLERGRWVGAQSESTLKELVQQHAPLQKLAIRRRTIGPWSELTAEAQIKRQLSLPISLEAGDTSLYLALKSLAKSGNVNLVVDPLGLQEEGISTSKRVSVALEGVSLRSALKILLEPLNLTFVIDGEVLKVTSKMRAQGPLIVVTYPVADLVIPIPGMVTFPKTSAKPAAGNQATAANIVAPGNADFDTLVKLITGTVDPNSWEAVGGPGSIRSFDTTLSLVIRQTQQTHKKIAVLLAQLRRLQDVQITLSSRIITLPKSRWEKLRSAKSTGAVLKRFTENQKRVILTGEQEKTLLDAFQKDEGINLRQNPKFTLFNGQLLTIPHNPIAMGRGSSLILNATISPDRRWVRLNVADVSRNGTATVNRATTAAVPDGKSLLIDVTGFAGSGSGIPELEKISYVKRLFKNTPSRPAGERILLLLKPRIIVQEK